MKILHLDTNHPLLIEKLHELGCVNHEDYTSSKIEIEEKIEAYDGIIIRSRFNIDKNFLDKAKNLKFIGRVGAGMESIDVSYAEKNNIVLISAPEGNRNALAEHALGMLLSLMNNLNKADREVKNGEWNREDNRGDELDGKTIGLIGYGNMGKAFAKKLSGFDVEVLCYDIKSNVEDANARQVDLKELQQKSDVLSLHTPLTDMTRNMVNSKFIYDFEKSFYLINTARGSSVVTKDLVEALNDGKIKGAGLDVLEYEQSSFENLFLDGAIPYDFEQLLAMNNVILTPHIAGWTHQSKIKLSQTIVDKVRECFFNFSTST